MSSSALVLFKDSVALVKRRILPGKKGALVP
jgi:hypothetical protein